MEQTKIIFEGKEISVPQETTIGDLFAQQTKGPPADPPLAAMAYNRLVSLDCALRAPTVVSLVYPFSREGDAVARRTASLMLYAAVRELYPQAHVVIGQALARGYFFEVFGHDVDEAFLAAVEAKMREYVQNEEPLVKEVLPVEEARAYFEAEDYSDTASLLQTVRESRVQTVGMGAFRDLQHGPVALHAGAVKHFSLVAYPPGMVLQFNGRREVIGSSHRIPPQQKLFQSYRETREWNTILGVPNVGRLNQLIIGGNIEEIIRVAEGFHEKKVAAIADAVVERRPEVRLVLIAGPSSSGKTTFSKRLSVQLQVAGIRPVTLSLDNWYVNRKDTPRDPKTGEYDFERLEALDLPLFNEHLRGLLAGEEVATPVFDFREGVRLPEWQWKTMKLEDNQVLLVEGIHGLNEELTASIPKANKFRVYVSALTQLCLDDHNRIFTSDSRLIRRIVRDARYRGYDAETTIMRWPSVRDGELKYIFPFQEEADVMFNSALVYEVSVLKVFAERFLLAVPPTSPAYHEAYRLLKFLEFFVPVFRDHVPQTSILREFIGGSGFAY
jgi:uridine kinase